MSDGDDAADKRDANALMLGGVGVAAIGVLGAAIGGAVCPVCIVAAPAMLGLGAFRRLRAARLEARSAPGREALDRAAQPALGVLGDVGDGRGVLDDAEHRPR